MAANLNVFKTSKKIAFYPNRFFFAKVHWLVYRKKTFDDMGALSLIDTFRENEERARKPLTPLQDKLVQYITLFCCHSLANCVLSYLALEVTLL